MPTLQISLFDTYFDTSRIKQVACSSNMALTTQPC